MKKVLLYLFFGGLLFGSCSFQDVEFKGIKSMIPKEITQDNAKIAVVAVLHNPNSFGFKVSGSKIGLYSGDVKVGDAKISHFKVAANSTENYDLTFDCDLLPSFYKEFNFISMLSGKKIRLRAKGWVKGKKFLLTKKVDVDFTKEFSPADFLK